MPSYEYRCRTCETVFEKTRPMAEASDPASCPAGHPDTAKIFSAVSVGGSSAAGAASRGGSSGGGDGGGGCCGGGCCS